MKKRVLKFCLRLILLLLFVSALTALSYPLGREGDFLLTFSRLDPWLLLNQWRLTAAFPVWGWLPLAVLAITAWWGRWFCRLICPLGTVLEISDYIGRLLFRKRFQPLKARVFRSLQVIAAPLLLAFLVVFLFEASWTLFFTPLALFNHEIVQILQGEWPILLIVLVVATLLLSRVWCAFLCPTGILFAFVARFRGWRYKRFHQDTLPTAHHESANITSRRQFFKLAAVLLLIGASLKAMGKSIASASPLRPPGAIGETEFGAVCNRCSRCIQVCPTKALFPMTITQGLADFATPEFRPRLGRCDLCQACQEVCPTGALVLTPVAVTKIGTAAVNKERCLAWHDEKLCFLCGEQCPVQAIDGDELRRPSVRSDKCVGCGACENGCPVEGEAAIRVFGKR